MATIVLGDDQRMRAARQQSPYQYVNRQGFMEGGDKFTPNDAVQIASLMFGQGGAADKLTSWFGSEDKPHDPSARGMLPTPAGPSTAFGLVPPTPPSAMPQPGRELPPLAGPSMPPPQPPPPPMYAAPDRMPGAGMQQYDRRGPEQPVSAVDSYRRTFDFQTPTTVPTQDMFRPPQDVSFPAMRDVPPSQMYAAGPAAAQAPQVPPPVAQQPAQQQAPQQQTPQQQAPQQQGGGPQIVRLPINVTPPPQIPPARPNMAQAQMGNAVTAAALSNAAQQPQQPGYDYAYQQRQAPQQEQMPQQQLSPEELYRQQIAQYQQELERRAMASLQIRPDASYPELVAAKERAMYGTPEDRAAFERAVMAADLRDVPPRNFDESINGSHRTRARQELLQGLYQGAQAAQMQQQQLGMANRKIDLSERTEVRKASNASDRLDIEQRKLMMSADNRKFDNWLAANSNNRKALESVIRIAKGALENQWYSEDMKAKIRQRLAAAENQRQQAGLAGTRAKATPYRVLQEPSRFSVSVGDRDRQRMFMQERDKAFELATGVNKAFGALARPDAPWTSMIVDLGVPGAQAFTTNEAKAKEEARKHIAGMIQQLADRTASANAIRPQGQGWEQMKMPAIPQNKAYEINTKLAELGVVVTPEVRKLIGLPPANAME